MDGWIRIGTKIESKQFDKQINRLKGRLKTLEASYDKALNPPQGFKTNEKNLRNLEIQIEQTRNKIIDLENAGQPKSGKNGFDKLYSSAKKLAFGILSIRTAYTILSRASSSYLATDTETTQKMQANWVGLGTILAPAIKFLVDLMRKAVIGVLHFMSVLTGIDFIAKANANALDQQKKATDGLRKANDKLTASFDEMNVLQDNSSIGVGVGTDDISQSLFDINELSEGTRNAITKVAEALKPIYEIIKNIVKYALDNPDVILALLGGTALLGMIGKIIGFVGAGGAVGTGLAGIWGILLSIASIGVITISILYTFKNYEKYKQVIDESGEKRKQRHEEQTQYIDNLKEESKQTNLTTKEVKKMSSEYKNLANDNLNLAIAQKDAHESLNALEKITDNIMGTTDSYRESVAENVEESWRAVEAWGELYKQGLLNEEQTAEYQRALGNLNEAFDDHKIRQSLLIVDKEKFKKIEKELADALLETYGITKNDLLPSFENFGDVTNNARDRLKLFIKEINKLDDRKVEIDLTMATDKAKDTLTKFFTKFQTTITTTFSAIGLKLPEFPKIKLAHGGIINNPGRGVSLGNGIVGGEAGREMVMPLDSQTMAQLGQEIGKWITINASIINQMNGRTISRELQKINADSDFAMNG
jgi:hypothetical protein